MSRIIIPTVLVALLVGVFGFDQMQVQAENGPFVSLETSCVVDGQEYIAPISGYQQSWIVEDGLGDQVMTSVTFTSERGWTASKTWRGGHATFVFPGSSIGELPIGVWQAEKLVGCEEASFETR